MENITTYEVDLHKLGESLIRCNKVLANKKLTKEERIEVRQLKDFLVMHGDEVVEYKDLITEFYYNYGLHFNDRQMLEAAYKRGSYKAYVALQTYFKLGGKLLERVVTYNEFKKKEQ